MIYTNNDPKNPFSACVASDLYLAKCWIDDPDRREQAHIPQDAVFRAKWEIAADQVEECIADGVRFSRITCDEEYTSVPEFIYRMNRSGQRVIGEVRASFRKSCPFQHLRNRLAPESLRRGLSKRRPDVRSMDCASLPI